MIDKKKYTDYLYSKLPVVYRNEDLKLGNPLYRYLQSLCLGGFEKVIEDSNNFLTLIDPENCPESIFPYLYESFGLEYYKDIPVEYHRKFLSNLGALMKRRGTNTAIHYLVATLTGFEVDLSYERQYNDRGDCIGRFLDIVFLVNTVEEAALVNPSIGVIEQFIKSQVPFYITPRVSALTSAPVLEAHDYKAGLINPTITQQVYPFNRNLQETLTSIHTLGVCVRTVQNQTLIPQI